MYRVYNVSQLLRPGAPNTLGLWASAGWADYFSFVRNASASLPFLCPSLSFSFLCSSSQRSLVSLLTSMAMWHRCFAPRFLLLCPSLAVSLPPSGSAFSSWLWFLYAQAERSLPADDAWEPDRRGL